MLFGRDPAQTVSAQYGVKNVYGDLGQIFAQSTMADPRVCAFMIGSLVKGLRADHVVWGTDAVWTGSPQWQIEALRRLEIPEEMQKKYGFPSLGRPTARSSARSSARITRGFTTSPRSSGRRSTTIALPRSRRTIEKTVKGAVTAPTVISGSGPRSPVHF